VVNSTGKPQPNYQRCNQWDLLTISQPVSGRSRSEQ
jgi:hypothetical protein